MASKQLEQEPKEQKKCRVLVAHQLAHRVRTGPEELSMKLGSKKIAISNLLVRLGSTFCHFFRTSVGRLLL